MMALYGREVRAAAAARPQVSCAGCRSSRARAWHTASPPAPAPLPAHPHLPRLVSCGAAAIAPHATAAAPPRDAGAGLDAGTLTAAAICRGPRGRRRVTADSVNTTFACAAGTGPQKRRPRKIVGAAGQEPVRQAPGLGPDAGAGAGHIQRPGMAAAPPTEVNGGPQGTGSQAEASTSGSADSHPQLTAEVPGGAKAAKRRAGTRGGRRKPLDFDVGPLGAQEELHPDIMQRRCAGAARPAHGKRPLNCCPTHYCSQPQAWLATFRRPTSFPQVPAAHAFWPWQRP